MVRPALTRFSPGVKVAVDIAMIAADKGFVSTEEIIYVIKWDTALIMKQTNSDNFSEIKVRELICRPR